MKNFRGKEEGEKQGSKHCDTGGEGGCHQGLGAQGDAAPGLRRQPCVPHN